MRASSGVGIGIGIDSDADSDTDADWVVGEARPRILLSFSRS